MNASTHTLNVGMVGLGMIFQETYQPLLYKSDRSAVITDSLTVKLKLHSSLTRTGTRAEQLLQDSPKSDSSFTSYVGDAQADNFFHDPDLHLVVIATPDSRHYQYAKSALLAGKHVLIEKPSVLDLYELDDLIRLAQQNGLVAKVVYHKLFDPDHRMLRTLVLDGRLRHVNSGYCSLLEPKSIAGSQFAEWIEGRNPATYVAVHYLKLIDLTFGPTFTLSRIEATGQRGLVGPTNGATWDSVQLRVVYLHLDQREAAFDIHTSWVNPDTFPGYVEQEVQFRFDNAVWNAHQRKRGVEVCIEDNDSTTWKTTPNHHYNADTIYPDGSRRQAGYGLDAIEQSLLEIAKVQFSNNTPSSLQYDYNSIESDRRIVAIVMATESLLQEQAAGHAGGVVFVNDAQGGLVMYRPGLVEPFIIYKDTV